MAPLIERVERNTHPDREPSNPHIQVDLGKGRSIALPQVVALALITCVGGFATAWLNKPSPGDPTVILQTVRNEIAAQRQELATRDAALDKRLTSIETQVSRLQSSQDTLRDRVNDMRYSAPIVPTPLGRAVSEQLSK